MPPRSVDSLESLAAFAAEFVSANPDGGFIGLSGDLGVGKTSFVRAVIQVLCARAGQTTPRVISPSYVLHQHYPLKPTVDHWDLYRMETLERQALWEMGFFEALEQAQASKGFMFVEWAERLPADVRPDQVVRFQFKGEGRELSLRT